MSFIKAKEHLKKYNLEDNIKEFTVSSATVKEAAKALNCEEQEIAKTMAFIVDGCPILIVTAGDQKIDNAKYKQEFHTKAKMILPELLVSSIGHEMGGICPFGINFNVAVYLDISLKRFNTIYPACGSSNSAVKLSIDELALASNYKKWIDVCKKV